MANKSSWQPDLMSLEQFMQEQAEYDMARLRANESFWRHVRPLSQRVIDRYEALMLWLAKLKNG